MGNATSNPESGSKRADIEERVLTATNDLLDSGTSFADLKIEKIAGKAGISRTAFYFYFSDKRELLVRLSEEVAEMLYREADLWWSSEGNGEKELRNALLRVSHYYQERSGLLQAVVEVSTYDEEFAHAWRALIGRFIDRTRQRIEDEQSAGRADLVPARETAFALAWMIERTLYQHAVQAPHRHNEELIDALTGICLRAVYGRI